VSDLLPYLFMGVIAIVIVLVDALAARRKRRESTAGTLGDDRVATMVSRQRAYGEWMKKEGRALAEGRAYTPAITHIAPLKKTASGNVLRLRRTQPKR
jgi:FtsZ-interacting cell division protein ZipA